MIENKRIFLGTDIHAATPHGITAEPDMTMYVRAISSADSDAHNIRLPIVSGSISPVFLADTNNGTFVYKFSAKELVIRNCIISHALKSIDVPAPLISKHNFQNIWFERYEYCPDQTLFEAIANGMSKGDQLNILKQVLYYQGRMNQLPTEMFQPLYYRHHYQTWAKTLKNKYPTIMFPAYAFAIFCLSRSGRQRVYHNDINTKNILVDKNGNLSRLLDLDAVALNNEIFAISSMLIRYPQHDPQELISFYELACDHKINRRLVDATLKLIKSTRELRYRIEDAISPGLNPYR